ncbi:hypothetical protein [Plantibacter sp. CFBP 8804]|uniref:hypothetical protein n=1 Tax=Plantibacter sp. CFBP 8804 TaxID=2775270 RepID=UPI0017831D28|nr:hypothetical protein [Plantibacter sp. CFBP 8804]MBD8516373.1 hypothetical protein [Plantibacter sp. CFBP 8804]
MDPIDCLPPTGSDAGIWPLIAVLLVGVGLGLLLIMRGRRRTTTLVLILALVGGGAAFITLDASPAQADSCIPTTAPTMTPTTTPPTTVPTPPAVTADFAVAFDPFTLPPRGGGEDVLTDYTESVPVTLTNVTTGTAAAPVSITVTGTPGTYWTVTGVLNSDGTGPATGITVAAAGPGTATLTVDPAPAASTAISFQLQLTYDVTTWDSNFQTQPDDSEVRLARPESTITLQLTGQSPGGGHTATANLPGYVNVVPAP